MSELFQKDLFPDTQGDEPTLSASVWLEGQNGEPKKVSLEPKEGTTLKTSKPKKGLGAIGKKVPKKAEEDEPDIMDVVKQLKKQVEDQEKRIKALEEKMV